MSMTAVWDMPLLLPLPLSLAAGESPVREQPVAFKVPAQLPLLKLLLLCIVNLFTLPDSEMKMGKVLRVVDGRWKLLCSSANFPLILLLAVENGNLWPNSYRCTSFAFCHFPSIGLALPVGLDCPRQGLSSGVVHVLAASTAAKGAAPEGLLCHVLLLLIRFS